MSRAPLNVIEWLEDMRRSASRDADRATEVLELIAIVESGTYDEDQAVLAIAEQSGNATLETIEDIAKALQRDKDLRFWADKNELIAGQPGDTLQDQLEALVEQHHLYEAQSFALSELCMAAGLLKPNDYKTDPLPLLRMFLPVV